MYTKVKNTTKQGKYTMKPATCLVVAIGTTVFLSTTAYADASYTSASYEQNGLIAQWDGIDNQGTGTHDPTATTWKDLVGNLDMTLTAKGSWNGGNALYVSGGGAGAQGADKTPAYKTRGMLKIEDDGTKLVYYKSGVILIVR